MSTTKTKIQWTDRTWNPVMGCSRVSPGCLNCYAEKIAARFSKEGLPFHLFAEQFPRPHWTGRVEVNETALVEPLRWRSPARVFVNSMSDLFHEGLHDDSIVRVFRVMQRCPHLTFQVLTKRALRMSDVVPYVRDLVGPLDNVWLGVSVENQAAADERIPLLIDTPAAVRFVSYEPALGAIDWYQCGALEAAGDGSLHWIIVGGESGRGARPFLVDWARHTLEQFRGSPCAVFVKQLGSHPVSGYAGQRLVLRDSHGGDIEEWPKDIRVRDWPLQQSKGGGA